MLRSWNPTPSRTAVNAGKRGANIYKALLRDGVKGGGGGRLQQLQKRPGCGVERSSRGRLDSRCPMRQPPDDDRIDSRSGAGE